MTEYVGREGTLPAFVRKGAYYPRPKLTGGNGFLAGDPPNGLVTLNNTTPLSGARVLVLLREDSPYYGTIVAETYTDIDGRWIVDDLDESLHYNVTVSKEGFNDLIVANVMPVNLPRLQQRHFKGQKTQLFSATLQPKGGSGAIATTIPNAAQLPAGLSYSGGVISGTISGNHGDYRILVHHQDSENERTEILTIDVAAAPLPYITAPQITQQLAAGVAITPIQPTVGSGVPPYTFSLAEGSAAWLVIDAETGEITGTPIDPQKTDAVIVSVEDADGRVATSDKMYFGSDQYRDNVVFHAPLFADLKETIRGNNLTASSAFTFAETGSPFGTGFAPSSNSRRIYGNLTDALGEDDYTIECWVRFGGNGFMLLNIGTSGSGWSSGDIALFNMSSNPMVPCFQSYGGSAVYNNAVTISSGNWTHLAGVRNGTKHTLYVGGTKAAEVTQSKANSNKTYISLFQRTSNADTFNGDICDVRITKSVARYTANFTPPTVPYPTW